MRLGFAVKVLGRPGLKSDDSRRWMNSPHLRVSLGYLEAIFDYLQERRICMYRISSNIAPYITHPEMPQFHHQIEECAEEIEKLGRKARALNLRLSMHPSQYIVLNSPREEVHLAAVMALEYHARFLDAMGLGPEAVVVIHGGGAYGDKRAAMDRFVRRYLELPERVRRRLVVENDEKVFSVSDVLWLHERTGAPVVFDHLHHRVHDPDGWQTREAVAACLATWPQGVVPKVHFSSPRTEPRSTERGESDPLPWQHGDWIDAWEFAGFLRECEGLAFDVMLEAKKKDLALLRLREELRGMGMDVDCCDAERG
ncbi:UV-endonuclease UvdE [Thermobaculum terrenum ATCC BAA-798]|uniref:UV-endonuclease UvdE n=1 Tax=Thermobaculum terrenum (strain ATCC BAA-798 / CCMEE 7001 / YNP1) TaxID=525904 RepID=D1CGQ9_THET1|nr:UV DNA damage repair endonuclease UvsE [Thermobaculum terrenum]ACZ42930.1 UV-endonuclease UvdE [Thermobaculum terrenum ATCC BAA-798]